MGAYLTHTIFLDWKEFIVNELRHTKISNARNHFSSQDFLGDYREDILNEAKYILGISNKGSMIDWERRYRENEYLLLGDPISIAYLDLYSEKKDAILNDVKQELGGFLGRSALEWACF